MAPALLRDEEHDHLTADLVHPIGEQPDRLAIVALGHETGEGAGIVVHARHRDHRQTPHLVDEQPGPGPVGIGQLPDGHAWRS